MDRVYVLIRPKNDISGEQRLAKMLRSRPFTFNALTSTQLAKVKAIECQLPQLSSTISDNDHQELIANVNLIFHVAACVKFDVGLW